MKKKKRLKLKKGPLVILILLITTIISSLVINRFFISLTLIGDNKIEIDIEDEYFENGYKATCFNKKSDNVKINDNIDTSKEGTYKVTYTLKCGPFTKKQNRTIEVKDIGKPSITLKGDEYLYVNKDTQYKDPGYEASDKKDGNISDSVKVLGEIDTSKVGTYVLSYEVEDSAGNKATTKRTVEVIDADILGTDITTFKLSNYYKENILEYESKEYDQIKDTIFLGDSNIVFLYERGNFIPKEQIWGKYNLNISQIRTSEFKDFATGKTVNLKTALDTHKPKNLIVSAGINSPLYMKEEDYKKEAEEFIKYMKENYSDVNLIFTSILPIYHGTVGLWHQKEINAYNFDMLELCHKYGINFINYADEVKDETGGASKDYFDCLSQEDCGLHLNNAGKEKYLDYLKHLNLERKIK